MCDISLIAYTFNVSELAYNDDLTRSQSQDKENSTPDRSNYTRVPKIPKIEYGDLAWYNPTRIAIFTDNVLINLINPIIDLANDAIVPPQKWYNEGFDSFWDNEVRGSKALINAPIDYVKNTYDYTVNTPFSQQMSDLGRDFSNPHKWEDGVAIGIGAYYGGRGMIPKAQTKLRSMPSGASPIPKLDYPAETTSDGFLFRGFNIKSPINLPAQRFGQLGIKYTDYWSIKTGSSKFLTRRIYAVKPGWNDLTQYTTGIIPKGTPIKIGIVGPQSPFYKYPGGSIQIRVMSKNVIQQTSKIVNQNK